jgi:hypothetical protein
LKEFGLVDPEIVDIFGPDFYQGLFEIGLEIGEVLNAE